MRCPVPYAPPVQPVLTSQQADLCSAIFLPSSSMYHFLSGYTARTAGSVTPRSVPAMRAV